MALENIKDSGYSQTPSLEPKQFGSTSFGKDLEMNAFVTNLWGVVFGINLAILMKVIGDDLFAFISFIMPPFL